MEATSGPDSLLSLGIRRLDFHRRQERWIGGQPGRSQVFSFEMERDRLLKAIDESAGSLVPKGGRPMTPDEVIAYVNELRDQDTD